MIASLTTSLLSFSRRMSRPASSSSSMTSVTSCFHDDQPTVISRLSNWTTRDKRLRNKARRFIIGVFFRAYKCSKDTTIGIKKGIALACIILAVLRVAKVGSFVSECLDGSGPALALTNQTSTGSR